MRVRLGTAPVLLLLTFALAATTLLTGCPSGGAKTVKFKTWVDPDETVTMLVPDDWYKNGGTGKGAWLSASEDNAKKPDQFIASIPTFFISKIADVPKGAETKVKVKDVLEGSAKAIYKEASIREPKQGPTEEQKLAVGDSASTVFDAKTKDGTKVKLQLTVIKSKKPAKILMIMLTDGAEGWSDDQTMFQKMIESIEVK